MATEEKQDTGQRSGNDILMTLHSINKGRLVTEASSKLDELVAAVARYEKKGTLTIVFDVAPGKEPGTVDTKASVAVKAPQPEHPAIFFVGDGSRLTRDDPSMDPMFGRDEAGGSR